MRWKFLARFRDEGLLLLRLGIGPMFIVHGMPKLLGGPDKWLQLGHSLDHVTQLLTLGPVPVPGLFGFLAGLAEAGGGLCLLLGLMFRPAALSMALTMAVAATMHLQQGDGLLRASHAIEAGILFLALVFIGPGRYSLDK